MDFVIDNFIPDYLFGWKFWLSVILSIIFILWIFYGGKNHEYIGLSPLKIGVDSSKYIDHLTYDKVEKSNTDAPIITAKPVDNTPQIPDIPVTPKFKSTKNQNKRYEKISFSTDDYSKEPHIDNLVEPCFSNDTDSIDSNDIEYINSPNTMALGDHKAYKTKKISKAEALCKKSIEEIYQKPFHCVRPDFLKNPETNRNLELDCYNDELKIAVEYNGIQHYKWPNYTNQTYEEFVKQIRRDQFKVNACDANGVYLITVPYNIPKETIKDYITYYLPENVKARQK